MNADRNRPRLQMIGAIPDPSTGRYTDDYRHSIEELLAGPCYTIGNGGTATTEAERAKAWQAVAIRLAAYECPPASAAAVRLAVFG